MVDGDANPHTVPFSVQKMATPFRYAAMGLLLGLCCDGVASDAQALGEGGSMPPVAGRDCSRIGAVGDREACFLALPNDQCRVIGSDCISVQAAHAKESELVHIEQGILASARARYASYPADDAEYLNDLQGRFISAAAAWRTYRDAYCQAEPLMQGMSRDEQQALALDCRKRLTRERIEQLKQLAKAIP